ncbi:Acidic fibroblast growth factor binding (FIBP) [Plasmodiophora brassicae]|uniref:Uncharacterized protein n=1 Tax=Plasmodiophora brassicae TaxID=37360 RepID=A0A0G4ITE7_PLABS|nr:hypothetical protein PBRA_006543 [Plasmodiophora brassicae]SPQ94512.1 unnamed protein product [Plasmodiophora brassicae]
MLRRLTRRPSASAPPGESAADLVFHALCLTPVRIDYTLYDIWIDGYSVDAAIASSLHEYGLELKGADECHRLRHCIRCDVQDQYNVFELFVPLLDRPGNFRSSFPLLELDAETLSHMVESYYSVDTDLCREIVGRKLTRHNFRKELEMLAERTHIQLPSVQRQIENLRRISRVLGEDDREERGINLVEEIRSQFLLSSALAVKLARLIFLARYRFETLKKKLRPANLSDLLNVAGIIMDKWTVPKTHDLDHEFISDLRHLKVTLSNNKDLMDVYRLQVEQQLREIIESGRGNTDLLKMSTRISAIVKVLCVIGSALNRPKTLRNLFLDITEQIVHPLCRLIVAQNDVQIFFEALADAFPLSADLDDLGRMWRRFIEVVGRICVIFFPQYSIYLSHRLRWLK